MSTTSNAAPARGTSGQGNHGHFGTFSSSSAQRPTYNTSSRVPSKRSDDDIQFISSQPVKKQKMGQTKLQIKITPPSTTGPAYHAVQPQQHHHDHHHHQQQQSPYQPGGQLQNQVSPFAVPEIQFTPAPVMAADNGGQQQQNKSNAYVEDRRISTGMVGLPSGFHDIEAGNAMRGVSLPLATCLDNFVLNQPLGRPRPMSSPPLSPKQMCPTTPFSMLDASISPTAMVSPHSFATDSSHIPRNLPTKPHATNQQHAVVVSQTMTPTNSPSPVPQGSVDVPMSSTPLPASLAATQSCEQPPDRAKQTPPITLPPTPTTPHAISHLSGAKVPCQACIAQSHRVMMPRAPALPTPIMSMPKMTSHTMPQIPCPPMHSYPPSPQQYMAMSPYNHPGYHPMMMPMHANGFQGALQHHGPMHFHPPALTPSQPKPDSSSNSSPRASNILRQDNMRHETPPTPSPLPATPTPASPAKSHPALSTKHRKPARNLIVDIAETCHERFPFEDVAKRQNVAVSEVREVYDAIIGVPLLVSASDRRRAGEVARSRKAEYRSVKRDILKEREETGRGTAEAAKDETVVSAKDIALRLGASKTPGNQ